MTDANLTDQITQIADADPEIAALWLYGSRARGDHHAGSDYDLAVAFTHWERDPLERRLRPELLAQDWLRTLELPDDTFSLVDIGDDVPWRKIIGLRNVLVHDYLDVDTEVLKSVIGEQHYLSLLRFAEKGLLALNASQT